jgi:hypothetical protein
VHGHPFYVWRKPLPRISDQLLECVIYLCPSAESAEAGEIYGGSGFLVSVPSENHEGWDILYAVTNSHVIREARSPIIRLNTQDGAKDTLPLGQDDWVHHQDGDDIAVCELDIYNDTYRFLSIPIAGYLLKRLSKSTI